LAGVQYLDALLSAIRDTADRLSTADDWMTRAERATDSAWRMSFLQAAHSALAVARSRLDEALAQLAALGPPERLPTLLAELPGRLVLLQVHLEASESRLSHLMNAALQKPHGHA